MPHPFTYRQDRIRDLAEFVAGPACSKQAIHDEIATYCITAARIPTGWAAQLRLTHRSREPEFDSALCHDIGVPQTAVQAVEIVERFLEEVREAAKRILAARQPAEVAPW